MSLDEAKALGLESMKRKREQKQAQKEAQKAKIDENFAKAPKRIQALLKELNDIANREAAKDPKVDENGKELPQYFYDEHTLRDLDWLGDIAKILPSEVKKAMKFTEDDLRFANKIKMLLYTTTIKINAGEKTILNHPDWLVEMVELQGFLIKEDLLVVKHPERKHETREYREIYLITGKEPKFIQNADWKKG